MDEDIDLLISNYQTYKELAEHAKEKLYARAEEMIAQGTFVTPAGKKISRRVRTNEKLDVNMFRTLYPDLYKNVVEQGDVTISMKSIETIKGDIGECIVKGEETVSYVFK